MTHHDPVDRTVGADVDPTELTDLLFHHLRMSRSGLSSREAARRVAHPQNGAEDGR